MHIRILVFLVVLLSLLGGRAFAFQVTESSITTEVKNRMPVDEVQSISADVGRLFCFTRIADGSGETSILHVWYRDGVEMARVELPVRSSDWRTWSSKRLVPEWVGEWRVDVLDQQGNLIKSLPFVLY